MCWGTSGADGVAPGLSAGGGQSGLAPTGVGRFAATGFSAGEALGQSVDLIIPEHLRSAHWHAFEQAMARGATRHGAEVRTTRATHQDGRRLYVDMTFSVVRDAAGHALGSAAMARDATERYLAERARKAAGG